MKNTHRIVLISAFVGLLAACGESTEPRDSQAQRDPAEGPRYADANRDGHVTREEASVDPALASRFERYDANADGELDRGEFARLEAGSSGSHGSGAKGAKEDEERHTLRPRREFPRPLD